MHCVLLNYLAEIPDHRDKYGRKFALNYILFFAILSILSVGETYKDIFVFINEHFDLLKQIFNLKWKKPPVRSTIWKIITKLDFASLENVFKKMNLSELPKTGNFICVDGKTLRGSASKIKKIKALRSFEVFNIIDQIVLAHIPLTNDKDHEIPAFKEFLELLHTLGIEYSVITADAMQCQKKTSNLHLNSI
jgi:histidyl-tRNA synthetase